MTTYSLEIYVPGHADKVLATFDSEHPFMAITPGDIIHPGTFPDDGGVLPDMLRVVTVEHILWGASPTNAIHKLCIYTEAVPDTPELRTGI